MTERALPSMVQDTHILGGRAVGLVSLDVSSIFYIIIIMVEREIMGAGHDLPSGYSTGQSDGRATHAH